MGLPATPKRDVSSILAHSREIIDDMHLAVLATAHTDLARVPPIAVLTSFSVAVVCLLIERTFVANLDRDQNGQIEPDARVIYSTAADGDMTVVFNTTRHSRKYAQMLENPHCSLTFVHKPYAGERTLIVHSSAR
jgi:hypothetical protein